MKKTFALLMCAVAPIACGDGDNPTQPDAATPDAMPDSSNACAVTPSAWTAPNFATNAAEALALRAQLDNLTGAMTMRGAETGAVVVDAVADLEAVYNGGTPVMSSHVHAAFDLVIDDAFAEFVPAVLAGVRDLIDTAWNPGPDGGIFATRLAAFNTGAIELRQIVDKGLFGGGLLYAYALKQTEGTINEAKIDAMAAAWGGNATLATTGVTDSANYTFQMGFHARVATALTNAKAYAADSKCNAERDAALVSFFRAWEQSLVARTLFYANAAENALATATTDDARANALHEFSEGLGLLIGFRGLANPTSGPLAGAARKITDADIDVMLTAYGVNRTNLSASTIGNFVGDTAGTFRTGVTAAEVKVKAVYTLNDADIALYRTPTSG